MKNSGKFMEKASAAYNKKYKTEGEVGRSPRAERVMGRAKKAWNKAEMVRTSGPSGEFDVEYANRMYKKAERLGNKAKRIEGRYEKKNLGKYAKEKSQGMMKSGGSVKKKK